jgi:hypothetical protein
MAETKDILRASEAAAIRVGVDGWESIEDAYELLARPGSVSAESIVLRRGVEAVGARPPDAGG